MKWLKRKLKIYNLFHYIIIFSALVMTIIFVMGFYLYRFYYKTVYNSFCSENESALTTVINQHENDMKIITDITMQMQMSQSTAKFYLFEQPEKSRALKNQLKLYTDVSQFFHLIYYYYQKNIYLYNHSTSANIDFFCRNFQLEELTEEELKNLLNTSLKNMMILPEQKANGHLLYNYFVADSVALYLMPLGPDYDSLLIFVVGNDYFDRILEADQRNNYIIYDGRIIASRGDFPISEEQLLQLDIHGNFQQKVEINKEQYLITAQSKDNGIVYVTLQPMELFFKRMMNGQWGIIFVLLLCCIPTALIILIGGRSLINWFTNMNHLLNGRKPNDYNMENMKENILALVNSEKESITMRKAVFIRNFVRNDYPDRNSVLEAASKVGINADHLFFVVAVLSERETGSEGKTFQFMLDLIDQEKDLDGFGVHLLNMNQKLLVLFADEQKTMDVTLNKIFTTGRSQCEQFVMALSYYHNDYANASTAYVEAITAFDNRYLMDNSRIIYYANVCQPIDYEIIFPATLQNLKNALKTKNSKRVKNIIQEICEQMKKEHPSMITFRWIYDNILRILLSEYQDKAQNGINDIFNVFTLSRCQTIDHFNELLMEACQMILENQPDARKQQVSVAENAMRYMNEHFHETELNMSVLADYLHISSTMLAIEFKNEIGISPSDFLASLRMEQAQKLLRETDMLIKDISLAVGYEDDHVFMRRFKKYTGKTPGQYRKGE